MKTYLGDGVYADVERGMIKLTTEGGMDTDNTIYLEPEVCEKLVEFYAKFQEAEWQESDRILDARKGSAE